MTSSPLSRKSEPVNAVEAAHYHLTMLEARNVCWCGEPKGHVGWVACLTRLLSGAGAAS